MRSSKKKILVLGSHGQLGQCLKQEAPMYKNLDCVYLSSAEADIRNEAQLASLLETHRPAAVINCAAYTAVDQAEDEREAAFEINGTALNTLARLCKQYDMLLMHISTDFVFSGQQPTPRKENDETEPLGVYGASKRLGEVKIQAAGGRYVIIRTGWLYSEYGQNFLKTMLRVGKERESVGVVSDQVGTPTYARDLAVCLLQRLERSDMPQGIYHFSNEGVASWYDFAVAIFAHANYSVKVKPISSDEYPTKAKRPAYSVLDKRKIKAEWGVHIDHWQRALARCVKAFKDL